MSLKHGKMLYIKFRLFLFCLHVLKIHTLFRGNHKSGSFCEAITAKLYKKTVKK